MKRISTIAILLGLLLGGLISCTGQGESMNTDASYTLTMSREVLDEVQNKKVFFGHQSVGLNILDGIKIIASEEFGEQIPVIKSREAVDGDSGYIAHAQIGRNYDPESKIQDFADLIRSGIGDKVDVAFMKFCYLDIQPDTDIQKIFSEYRNTIEALKTEYPNVTFVHVTVPLLAPEQGVKTFAKRILGRPLRGYEDNLSRHRYNELLRSKLGSSDPVFDLAAYESTFPDGNRFVRYLNDQEYYAMVPGYTYDAGHLNEYGKRMMGEKLLQFLADL